jgi:hypothetical protein
MITPSGQSVLSAQSFFTRLNPFTEDYEGHKDRRILTEGNEGNEGEPKPSQGVKGGR